MRALVSHVPSVYTWKKRQTILYWISKLYEYKNDEIHQLYKPLFLFAKFQRGTIMRLLEYPMERILRDDTVSSVFVLL